MRWSKSKTLAEKFALGDLSFDRLVQVLDEAIAYGRAQEKASVRSRLARLDISEWGAMDSGEVLGAVVECVAGGDQRTLPGAHTKRPSG